MGLTTTDPIFDTITLLTRDNPSLADYASSTLRQLLVDLVDLTNVSAARDLLPKLSRVLHDDVAVLPLWQYSQRFAVSKRVAGIVDAPASTYEGIVGWKVEPGLGPVGWSLGTSTESP